MDCRLADISQCFKHCFGYWCSKFLKQHCLAKLVLESKHLIQNWLSWCRFTRKINFLPNEINSNDIFVNDIVEITDHRCCVLSGPPCIIWLYVFLLHDQGPVSRRVAINRKFSWCIHNLPLSYDWCQLMSYDYSQPFVKRGPALANPHVKCRIQFIILKISMKIVEICLKSLRFTVLGVGGYLFMKESQHHVLLGSTPAGSFWSVTRKWFFSTIVVYTVSSDIMPK